MALSSAGAMAGGLNLGAGMGGNIAIPMQPPQFHGTPNAPQSTAQQGPTGAGGAYDLRGQVELGGDDDDDLTACLGVDVGTDNYSAVVYLQGEGLKPLLGPLPTSLVCDPTLGVKGLKKWLAKEAREGMPKGWRVSTGAGGEALVVSRMLRMIGLGGKGQQAIESEAEASGLDISKSTGGAEEDDDTSGIKVVVKSPQATSAKDKSLSVHPEQLLALLFVSLKLAVKERYGRIVNSCTLAVPASFSDTQRVALQRAVFTAGMRPLSFVSTPLAAVIGSTYLASTKLTGDGAEPAQGSAQQADGDGEELVVAICVGASCVDVGVVKVSSGAAGEEVRVLGLAGDSYSGGIAMDRQLARALKASIDDRHGAKVANDAQLWRRLLGAAKAAREALSADARTEVKLAKGCCGEDAEFEFVDEVTRTDLESAVAGVLESFKGLVDAALAAAKVQATQVQRVVLCGGCSHTPALLDAVKSKFKEASVQQLTDRPLVCARGAAVALAVGRKLNGAASNQLINDLTLTQVTDVVARTVGLVDVEGSGSSSASEGEWKEGQLLEVLFGAGNPLPESAQRTYAKGVKTLDLHLVQQTPSGAFVSIQHLGNPLLVPNERGFQVLADEVQVDFQVDTCGLVGMQVGTTVLPDLGRSVRLRKFMQKVMVILVVLAVVGGGYLYLKMLEEAPMKAKREAKYRLEAFYKEHAPDKLDSLTTTVDKYFGRYHELYKRLEKKYGVKVPRVRIPPMTEEEERERKARSEL